MPVREYQESDLAHLRAIHAKQGFDYALPDLSNPLFRNKKGFGEQRAIVGAAFLRLTAEAYLLLDPGAGTPRERWQWLLALHAAAEHDAWQRGSKTPRLAAAAHRQEIRQAYSATRLDPRRRLDAVLQKTSRCGLARSPHVRFFYFQSGFMEGLTWAVAHKHKRSNSPTSNSPA